MKDIFEVFVALDYGTISFIMLHTMELKSRSSMTFNEEPLPYLKSHLSLDWMREPCFGLSMVFKNKVHLLRCWSHLGIVFSGGSTVVGVDIFLMSRSRYWCIDPSLS